MTRVAATAALFALLASASAAPAETAGADAASVRLRFENLRGGGKVVVALFSQESRWHARDGAMQSLDVPVTGGAAEASFQGLPPGRYAVMAYHDRNADGRLNTLPVGMPTEPYGFSNDARGMFGPPPWRSASFEVSAGRETRQAIRLF